MTLTFYTTNSPNNALNKILSDSVSLSGTLRDENEIEKPNITGIDTTGLTSTEINNIFKANYIYIPDFNRYYFIVNKTVVSDVLINIALNVDVLMSFKDEILEQECLIERSAIYNSQYVNDTAKPVYNFPMVLTKTFSNSFDDFHYYLSVAGTNE